MNDFSRLEQKLAKLRQRERAAGEKRVMRGDHDRLLAAVVTEIDETILPRRVSFQAEDGPAFHLAVANRRLQALLAPAPAAEGAAQLADTALNNAEDPNVAALKAVLEKVFGKADAFSITTHKQSGDGFPSDIGVPAAQLSRAWGIATTEGTTPKELLASFVSGLGDRSIAWLRIEGEDVADQYGDADTLGMLGEHAAIFLDGYLSKREQIYQGEQGPACLVLAAGDATPGIIFLDCGEAMAFVAVRAAAIGAIARDWQSHVAI